MSANVCGCLLHACRYESAHQSAVAAQRDLREQLARAHDEIEATLRPQLREARGHVEQLTAALEEQVRAL